MGWLKQATAAYSAGLAAVALILLAGGALALALRGTGRMTAGVDAPCRKSHSSANERK